MRDGLNLQDTADTLDRTLEDVAQRWADIKAKNREVERRGRGQHRREESRIRRRPAIQPLTKQIPPAAPGTAPVIAPVAAPAAALAAALAATRLAATKRARSVRPTVQPTVRHISPKPVDPNTFTVCTTSTRYAVISHTRTRPRPYVKNEDEEAEDGDGEALRRARERSQNSRRPTTNQAPSATPTAKRAAPQWGRSVQSTSRKPANVVFKPRQRSPSPSYRWTSERRPARLRPIHGYRSPTPQGHRNREQSAVELPTKPAAIPAAKHKPIDLPSTRKPVELSSTDEPIELPSNEPIELPRTHRPVELPDNSCGSSRRVWTRGAHGWESYDIRVRF